MALVRPTIDLRPRAPPQVDCFPRGLSLYPSDRACIKRRCKIEGFADQSKGLRQQILSFPLELAPKLAQVDVGPRFINGRWETVETPSYSFSPKQLAHLDSLVKASGLTGRSEVVRAILRIDDGAWRTESALSAASAEQLEAALRRIRASDGDLAKLLGPDVHVTFPSGGRPGTLLISTIPRVAVEGAPRRTRSLLLQAVARGFQSVFLVASRVRPHLVIINSFRAVGRPQT